MIWPSARRTRSRHHTRARLPRCLFKATGLVARDAFHRLDTRHRCQAGLARVGWFASARSPDTLSPEALLPCRHAKRPTRATRRRRHRPRGRCRQYSERCLSPTSATDPQHEHPRNRWTPRLLRLAAPSARVEIRLTPSLQLRPRSRPSPPARTQACREGDERRISGPALRRGRPFRPPSTLGARPLTHPVTARTTPPKAEPPGQPRAIFSASSSKDPASTTRSAFCRRSPRVACLRRCRGTPSTSAITTVPEHDRRTARYPARPAEGYPRA